MQQLSNFTRDQLIIEAETLEECGEYLHVELMGYSPKELRAAAMASSSSFATHKKSKRLMPERNNYDQRSTRTKRTTNTSRSSS